MNVPTRVLVVDDDPIVCELIQEILSAAEMDSLTLTDSADAAKRISQEKFDAIFLDVNMPSPNGIELTRQIRASGLNRSTSIVVITGEEDRALLARAFEAGANFFLFKPIDRHRMLPVIRITKGYIHVEKRRYQRVKSSCRVSLEWGQERLSGRTLDLSLGGMCLLVSRVLPMGSTVRLSLELKAGTPPLRLAARVVRVSENDCMGLKIENAGSEESKRLQEFLLPLILAKID
jgi:CheY-like chemotaxis protein